jgi:hypothetical protein
MIGAPYVEMLKAASGPRAHCRAYSRSTTQTPSSSALVGEVLEAVPRAQKFAAAVELDDLRSVVREVREERLHAAGAGVEVDERRAEHLERHLESVLSDWMYWCQPGAVEARDVGQAWRRSST